MPNLSQRWQRALQQAAAQSDITADKTDVLSQQVPLNASPSQAANWVQNNVTDLASAKTALVLIVKILFFVILVLRENGFLDEYLE